MRYPAYAALLGLAAGPVTSVAEDRTREAATGILGELQNCRIIAADAGRLACFDSAAGKLAEATAAGDLKIVDREAIRATRRSLFGFELPRLPFFKGDDSAADTPSEIDAVVGRVGATEFGKVVITMEDGAVWRTTEPLPRDPRPGMPVHLKEGAFGDYFMRVGSMRSVRAQRIK